MNILRKTVPLLALAGLLAFVVTGTAQAGEHYMKNKKAHVVAGLQENGNFVTLVSAVKTAGLVETLQGSGPFTVFAPHDAAFAKLPAGSLDALVQDKEQLKSVLLFHVVSGKMTLADLERSGGVVTLHGAKLPVTVVAGNYYVGTAKIEGRPIQTSNGVIYTISEVQMPPAELE